MADLDAWSRASDRKPLVIRGARQVGKTRVHRCDEGVTFPGIRFDAGAKRRLPAANVRRMRRKLRAAVAAWRAGNVAGGTVRRMWVGWRGHALQGGGEKLLKVLEEEARRWTDSGETCVPRGSRRRVEQPSVQRPLRQSQQEPSRGQEYR